MTKRTTKKKDPRLVKTMKVLRMNGMSYTAICDALGSAVSLGTVHNYTKDVTQLPAKMRKNPFEVAEDIKDRATRKIPTNDEIEKVVDKTDYKISDHEPGEPWKGPVDSIELDDLIGTMRQPTNFHSPLTFGEWFNYYLAPSFFGDDSKLSKTQIKLINFIEKYPKVIIEVFRNLGKTVLVDGYILYDICENRDITMAIQSREKSISVKRVTHVQRELMTNKRIIADYGYLPHEKKWGNVSMSWKQSELTVKRTINKVDPTLCALSWKDTKMLGGHFDIVIFDDPWSEKFERSSSNYKEKWLGWYDGTYQGCLNEGGKEIIICTPKGPDDIYAVLEKRKMHFVFKQPAILKMPTKVEYIEDNNGVIIGVEYSDDGKISDDGGGRFDMKYFLLKKKSMKPIKWQQEFQINPLPPRGLVFNWDNLKFFSGKDAFWDKLNDDQKKNKNDYVRVIGAMDLAFGTSDRADFTTLVVVAFYDNEYYLLDCWAVQGIGKTEKAAMIRSAKSKIQQLEAVYVEADLQQGEYVKDLKKMISSVSILPILSRQQETTLRKHSKLSGKTARIMSQLDIPIESKELHINKHCNAYDELAKELRGFPNSNHDDLLDALGNCLSKLSKKSAMIFGFSG